jgi:ATP-dependent Clp protease ATP-binding subunit ClpA
LAIIEGLRSNYERHHKVRISDEALAAAVEYSGKLLPDRHYPDKAIDAMDEAAAKVRLGSLHTHVDKTDFPVVNAEDIKIILQEWAKDLESFHRGQQLSQENKGRTSPPDGARAAGRDDYQTP